MKKIKKAAKFVVRCLFCGKDVQNTPAEIDKHLGECFGIKHKKN